MLAVKEALEKVGYSVGTGINPESVIDLKQTYYEPCYTEIINAILGTKERDNYSEYDTALVIAERVYSFMDELNSEAGISDSYIDTLSIENRDIIALLKKWKDRVALNSFTIALPDKPIFYPLIIHDTTSSFTYSRLELSKLDEYLTNNDIPILTLHVNKHPFYKKFFSRGERNGLYCYTFLGESVKRSRYAAYLVTSYIKPKISIEDLQKGINPESYYYLWRKGHSSVYTLKEIKDSNY